MATEGGEKKLKRVIPLNGEKLGHIGGAIMATIVMIICFVYQRADAATTAIRVAWTFVIGYGVTFFFVRTLLRVTLTEFVLQAREKKGKRLGKDEESEEAESAPVLLETEKG